MKIDTEKFGRGAELVLFCSFILCACGGGGGGGGGGSPVSEAIVTSVSNGYVLSQSANNVTLSIPVVLSQTVVNGVSVIITSVTPISKAGSTMPVLGSAVMGSGDSCTPGADFAVPSVPYTVTIPAGSTSPYNLPVATVCPSGTALSPDKTFLVGWTSGNSSGTVVADIVNNQPGGLASMGTMTGIQGTTTFGRDTIPITNSNTDGHLGLSYSQQPSSGNWQCTYDNVTGLTWQAQSGGLATYTFAQAQAYVATVNAASQCGYTDWRLPTVSELESLVDFSISDATKPAADSTFFPNMQMDGYWSSDIVAGTTVNAWFVNFGSQGATGYQNTTHTYHAILVRGASTTTSGNCTSSNSQYVDNGDGTVTDSRTQLMWMQCNMGQSGKTCSGTVSIYNSTSQMLQDLNSVNQKSSTTGLGYSDWRIPTVKELNSLVNRSCTDNSNGAINAVAFPNNGQLSYVTATVYAPNTADIWAVDFSPTGSISWIVPNSGGGRPMRLVRAGQ